MSGGSYNYISMDQIEDLFLNDRIETLERMVARLFELGATTAAQEAQSMVEAIKSTKEAVAVTHARLNDVFHAVEWLDSGDGDKESVQEALREYMGARPNATDFPSPAMRRQRKYWQTTAPVQPVIVSRYDSSAESDTVKHDWYFSCGENSVFLSGYRRYEQDVAGNWFIAARWYPEVHALCNLIPIVEVPFPDDVVREAIEKGYDRALPEGFQVVKEGQHVMVMAGNPVEEVCHEN